MFGRNNLTYPKPEPTMTVKRYHNYISEVIAMGFELTGKAYNPNPGDIVHITFHCDNMKYRVDIVEDWDAFEDLRVEWEQDSRKVVSV